MEQSSIQSFEEFALNNSDVPADFIKKFKTSIQFDDKWLHSDAVCEILGYRNDSLFRALEKFKENEDFQLHTSVELNNKGGNGHKNTASLSPDCFKQLAMQKMPEVRKYYIQLEKVFKQFVNYLSQVKDNQLNTLKEEIKKLQRFGCVYMIYNKESQEPVYIGQTINSVETRFKNHLNGVKSVINNHEMKYIRLAAEFGRDFKKMMDIKVIAKDIPDGEILNSVEQILINQYKDTVINDIKSNQIIDIDITPYIINENKPEEESKQDINTIIEETTIKTTTTIKEQITVTKKQTIICSNCNKELIQNKDKSMRKHKCNPI